MGVGRYNIDDDDEDYEYVSLWSHSRPFRRLVYCAILLTLAVVYGFYVFHQAMMLSKAHNQRIQATLNNVNTQSTLAGSSNAIAPVPVTTAATLKDSLENYPLADDWIASKINPHRIVPALGFDAYYFNSEDPTSTIIHKENRPDIRIKYSYDEFYGIPSQNFGGYWIGKFIASQDGTYDFTGDADGAMRILLNGRVVSKGKNRSFPKQSLYLKQGEYILEVEYENDYFSTEFEAKLARPVKIYDKRNGELKAALSFLHLPPNTQLFAASVRGSPDPSGIINITSDVPDPYILIVNSHDETINWNIFGSAPRAIIYEGNDTVASVGQPPMFKSESLVSSRTFQATPSCSCHKGIFNCSGIPDPTEEIQAIKDWTGFVLAGGTNEPSNTMNIHLPSTYLTSNFIETYKREYEKERQECAVPHLKQPISSTQ